VLCVPEIEKDRYYSVMLTSQYTFNFGYIGSRAAGYPARVAVKDIATSAIGVGVRYPHWVTCGRRLGKSLFDVAAALVECGHVSGLLMRPSDRWP
jgi:hypothetical protein